MQSDLVAADIDPTPMSDDKLRAELRRHAKSGMVSFESSTATTATKPEIPLGRFLRQKKKELKWWVVVFVIYFLAACVSLTFYALSTRPVNWVTMVISWLCCFGVYAFLFVGRLKGLWLYVPCSWAFMAVGWYVWYTQPFLGESDVWSYF
jgi:Mn2+/Fe2+ NRAMP family transporter